MCWRQNTKNVQYAITTGSNVYGSKFNYVWWNNIIKLEQSSQILALLGNAFYELGKGELVLFWESLWLGDLSLRESFHELFVISKRKGMKVREMGRWEGITWVWEDMCLGNCLLSSKVAERQPQLLALLEKVAPVRDVHNRLYWRKDLDTGYNSKCGYEVLVGSTDAMALEDGTQTTLRTLWTTDIPFKVKAFVWRCFLNRFATKDQLLMRGIMILNSDFNCISLFDCFRILRTPSLLMLVFLFCFGEI